MGCCGSCGGEAPNHTNEQDKSKEKDKEATSQPQEQDKEKKQSYVYMIVEYEAGLSSGFFVVTDIFFILG